ncbi:MAG: DUF3786 domain-containing protein [Desulfobacteraceae bacterium]|nr:DUF3786 domain-containing protein [Desulfobacteraceae bacterium]
MALSVVDLYTKILPKTNCKDCGFATCLAFAGMVVSEKHPLENCPHIKPDMLKDAQKELEEQYKAGKWLKKDMAAEALQWAKEKACTTDLKSINKRIGGKMIDENGKKTIALPYFHSHILITAEKIIDSNGKELTRNEQTFVYIHMAKGGSSTPTGRMKSFKEFPNTVSKIKSMNNSVEKPLKNKFGSRLNQLEQACIAAGAINVKTEYDSPDLAYLFQAFPMVPVVLIFWDAEEGFEEDIKLLFDETALDHLDVEAIMFLSEHIGNMLINAD